MFFVVETSKSESPGKSECQVQKKKSESFFIVYIMILSIKSMIVLYSTYKAAYIIKDIVGTFKYVYRTFRSSSKYHVIGEDDEYERSN